MWINRLIRRGCLTMLLVTLLWLCSACASGAGLSTLTPSPTSYPTMPMSMTMPDEEVAASIPVGANPDIMVQGGTVSRLTFIGTDTATVSTDSYAIPYKKMGNMLHIDFGEILAPAMVIHIPRQANLTITLTRGSVSVDTIQGQVNITLSKTGTISLKHFTPSGTDALQTGSGPIDVTFTQDSSCILHAHTDSGTIVSSYPAIPEVRNGSKADASGTMNSGSQVTVTLNTGSGSISLATA